ncbi:MAG: hypothetical protein ACRELA_22965, partial [Candidatus Rokuibacteriota bacterium]
PPIKASEIRKIFATGRVLEGEQVNTVCAELRLQRHRIERLAKDVGKRGLLGLLSYEELTTDAVLAGRSLGIAQMLLGVLAERRFEELSDEITGPGVLRIEDHRPSRTDTDYRLLNGGGHPICRLNIKFHGTLFREARRYVGLEPDDCFALATYKINNALKRQEEERLPYVFLILSVPELSATEVAKLIPPDYVWTLAVLQGRRLVEEAIVERLRTVDYRERFRSIFEKMPVGKFRIVSARKAHILLHEKLFQRVHALSLKAFTSKFRNAEVDMHFSLSTELTPVRTFFELLTKESPQRVAVGLDRGDY